MDDQPKSWRKTNKHPAHMWPTRWFFHDRSDEPDTAQIVDILTDIRNAVFLILLINIFV